MRELARRYARSATALSCVALALGCASQRPPTEVFLLVDAETALRADASSLRLRVSGSTVGGASEVALDRLVTGAELEWPVTVGIVPRGGDTTRGVRVEATLTSTAGATVRASARTSYLPDETRVLRLSLEACCAGVTCTDTESCVACTCVSDAVDVRTLPAFGADAGR